MRNDSCQSCLMPFRKDPGQRENDQYCTLCFKAGRFLYQGSDLKEFQRLAYQRMLERGTNRFLARIFAFSIRFAPRWKK